MNKPSEKIMNGRAETLFCLRVTFAGGKSRGNIARKNGKSYGFSLLSQAGENRNQVSRPEREKIIPHLPY